MRIWLDPNRLEYNSLTTNDVLNALKQQNVQVGQQPAPKGQDFQLTINTLTRSPALCALLLSSHHGEKNFFFRSYNRVFDSITEVCAATVSLCVPRVAVMMAGFLTYFGFIIGVEPLVVATGAGAAGCQSLGTAVCFGMLVATLLEVFFSPVMYVPMQGRRREGASPPASPVAAGHGEP
jgi:multidrug efflux pump subunit AcrB